MGSLNITPDYFYDGGKYTNRKDAINQIDKMIDEGVDIIDIGAASSRPFAKEISIKEERKRLEPILNEIIKNYPEIIISIDTYRSEIAKMAIDSGATIINDIYGGNYDERMLSFVAKKNIPYIMMHMKGNPSNMQKEIYYDNFENEILDFFKKQKEKLDDMGHTNLIIDPGFGFGKSINQNFKLINLIPQIKKIHENILIGVSRKSMIYKTLSSTASKSLNGTSVLNVICILKGANFIRVHDVKESKEAVKLINLVKNNS